MLNRIVQQDFESILQDRMIDWSAFAGKTVLISGANGFLPSYMAQTLLYVNTKRIQEPVRIIGLVRDKDKATKRYTPFLTDPHLTFIEHDITEELGDVGPVDYIIHAASPASPSIFFTDPVGTINANTLGTTHLLSVARKKKISSFLYFSTGEVYGDIFEHKASVAESDYGRIDPLEVRNCYAESKKMGETMCSCWHYQYGVPVKIIRPSHTYGPGLSLDDSRAFASFVASIVNKKDIVLKSDGRARRSFCYLADAVRAYFLVLLNGINGEAYNVGNDQEMSILELANMLVDISGGTNSRVVFAIDGNAPSNKASHGLLSNDKVKRLGWSPCTPEREGFERTINSFLEDVTDE